VLDVGFFLKAHAPARLGADLACCGRKANAYPSPPAYFCAFCERSYDRATRSQVPNFAWSQRADGTFAVKEAAAGGKIINDAWRYHKDSGLSQEAFREVVRQMVDEFNQKYRSAHGDQR
jgi:hypothetical protein